MKKLLVFVSVIALGMLAFVPLDDKKEDRTLSCDPVIDARVKAELVVLRKSDRSEIAKESREFQRAFYRSLTPRQKAEIWNDKISSIRRANWNNEERAHLETLFSKVDASLFDMTEEEGVEFTRLFKQWQEKSQQEFGWSKENLYYLIANPFEDRSEWKMYLSSKVVRAECECFTGVDLTCTLTNVCSSIGGCVPPEGGGCGAFGLFSCNGTCQPPTPT